MRGSGDIGPLEEVGTEAVRWEHLRDRTLGRGNR